MRRQAAKEREERGLMEAAQHKEEVEERKEQQMLRSGGEQARRAEAGAGANKAGRPGARALGVKQVTQAQDVKKMVKLLEYDVLKDLSKERSVISRDRRQEEERAREQTPGKKLAPSAHTHEAPPAAAPAAKPSAAATNLVDDKSDGILETRSDMSDGVDPSATAAAAKRLAASRAGSVQQAQGSDGAAGATPASTTSAKVQLFDAFADVTEPKVARPSSREPDQRKKETYAIWNSIFDGKQHAATSKRPGQPAMAAKKEQVAPALAATKSASAEKELLARAENEQRVEAAKAGKFLQPRK